VAFDPKTGDLGVAVESRYFAVGTVVPWAKAGVGAVATQAIAKPSYGSDGLAAMAEGESASDVLARLLESDSQRAVRQVAMIDTAGRVAAHTGEECQAWAGHHSGLNFCVQGNLLAGEEVLKAMARASTKARDSGNGELAEWLVAALEGGQAAGGDRRGQHSAALLVVRDKAGLAGENDRYIDVRVDEHAKPLASWAVSLLFTGSFISAIDDRLNGPGLSGKCGAFSGYRLDSLRASL
jgi:uncharacterized Ntn-hydrolase superfamily protein